DSIAPKAVPFHFSSYDTGFAMQGDFEGEYRVYPRSVEISLSKAVIRISEHCPYKGRREFAALSFRLATNTPDGKWDMVFESQKFFVNRIMIPGDEYPLEPTRFSIPKEETTDLSKHWLVVQLDDNTLDDPQGRHIPGFAFAHSSKDIFIPKKKQDEQ
ncbi:MAG TPA: hypothetical protein VGO69_05765, partial [Pyrinomonadaceae bacterium]|nr:hypothetical protein [Pyrinomonadaceae bacterium]